MLYALQKDTNEFVHVDSVKNGNHCNCICPECKLPVIAKQGEIVQHHFAHEPNLDIPIACTFNLIKSCARRLIEHLISNLIICVPPKRNAFTSEKHSKQIKLNKAKRTQNTHPSFYDVSCCGETTKSNFWVRFKIDEIIDFDSDDKEVPKRFLLIDVFEFVNSFDHTIKITDEAVIALLLRDSQYKKGCDKTDLDPHVVKSDGKCCQRSAEQGFNFCVTCKREF